MSIVIRNGHLVDPANGIDKKCSIFIEKQRIASLGKKPKGFKITKEINAAGKFIFPGLIDLSVRLREPGQEHKATIASESLAAVTGGITRMVCPPDTYPIIDTPAMVHMIQNRADDVGFARVHPLGALTVGLRGERLTDMAMLMDAGCAAVSNGLESVDNTLVMRRAMQYASTFDIPLFLTPRDKWLQGNGVVHEGEISTRLGLPAIPEAAETVGVARDLALIETSGVSGHFDLISCGRSVTMIAEAQKRRLPVTAGVAIHQLLCSENNVGAFDTRYKVNPPLRTEKDRKSLIKGVANGQIAVICSDHQPHGADAKLVPFSEAATGIAGLETLLSLSLSLADEQRLSMLKVIAALTTNPAKIIGLDSGHLAVGAVADLCIYDSKKTWILDQHSMVSRGRNSPFMNKELQGKVSHTIINGKLVYQDKN